MKKFSFVACLLTLVCITPSFAQNASRYRFDNFDIENGVRIESAAQTVNASSTTNKVRLTSKSSSANRASARSSSQVYTQHQSIGMASGRSLEGFTTGNQQIDALIVEAGGRHGVDPLLLYAIMHQESTFKARAISNKGARGLMQLMPATAMRFGVTNIFDPRQNIDGGAKYVRWLLNAFDGDVALALAGYNAGEGAVMKYGRRVPPYRETQEYVRRISNRYTLMRDPESVRHARRLTPVQEIAATQTEQQQTLPLNIYERHVYAVKLSDGRLKLVSQ